MNSISSMNEGGRTVHRPLHEVEADEAGDQRDDDGESGFEHRKRGGTVQRRGGAVGSFTSYKS